jgi:hypothetical protein
MTAHVSCHVFSLFFVETDRSIVCFKLSSLSFLSNLVDAVSRTWESTPTCYWEMYHCTKTLILQHQITWCTFYYWGILSPTRHPHYSLHYSYVVYNFIICSKQLHARFVVKPISQSQGSTLIFCMSFHGQFQYHTISRGMRGFSIPSPSCTSSVAQEI